MKKHIIVSLFLLLFISPFYSQNSDLNIIINRKSDIQKAKDYTAIDFYLKDIDSKIVSKLVNDVSSYPGVIVFTLKEMNNSLDLYKGYIKFSSTTDFIGLEKIFVSYKIKSYTVEGVKKTISDLNKMKITANGKVSE